MKSPTDSEEDNIFQEDDFVPEAILDRQYEKNENIRVIVLSDSIDLEGQHYSAIRVSPTASSFDYNVIVHI